ncbi:hypothetical protein GL218_09246 [Daldinia childiae]|uniref:uncharacterized protein n=1 Tax=Daldinia childiae TaxID=326645 RepID=UPI0014479AE8|nr:uncharacterized protein GL218_09246 [Daldinia childiae]KAF3065940.1 hypothetical protein GL218_09246 [Daldinia childiae]
MPHKEEPYTEFTPELYPPFPSDVPTVSLETITLSKLFNGDAVEQDRVFEACVGRGFFYLDLDGCATGNTIRRGAEQIALAGERVFRLPLAEKMDYKMAKSLFGYKYAGSTVTDKAGTRDTAEFFNVGKNDMIVPNDQRAFCRDDDYEYLAERLGIDPSELTNRHRIEEPSGDHVRITRGPPRETDEMPEIQTPSHTDFGTITILMNWLGGLQVWSESARKAQLSNGQPDVPG